MRNTESAKFWLTFGALALINVLFGYKYLERYTDLAGFIAAFVLVFQMAVFYFRSHSIFDKWLYFLPRVGFFVLLAFLTYLHMYFPVHGLNVDRWSVISSFWEAAFAGEYPYFAQSHMGNPPGPLPMYFVMALPFHLIGELAILSLIGYALWFNRKLFKPGYWIVVLLLSSFYMYWEILTRSNIFTNAVLVVLLLIGMEKEIHKKSHLSLWWVIPAGLLLSTRSIFALAYIPFFLFYFRNGSISFGRLALFTGLTVAVLGLTLLPFILLFPEEWSQLNPFIIQSTFLMPQGYGLLFISLAVVFGFLLRQAADIYLSIGMVLFLSILVYSVYHIATRGFQAAYFESSIDISYFILSAPFLLYYLHRITAQKV
jgi:hypothetical protein